MKRFKYLKTGLIVLDVLLGALACAFGFNFLLFSSTLPPKVELPQEPSNPVRNESQGIYRPEYYNVIKLLPNPLVPPQKVIGSSTSTANRPSLSTLLKVMGTMPNQKEPSKAAAVLELLNRQNQTVVVYYGEDIADREGNKISDLSGVKIVEVYLDRVVFNNNGQREELFAPKSELANVASPTSTTSEAKTGAFASKRLSESADKIVWGIDSAEREWAFKNQDVLFKDLTLSLYASGGLKIEAIKEGSLFAQRDFQVGDVVKAINGKQVKNLTETRKLIEEQAQSGKSAASVLINREGRMVTLEFRLKQ